ncbi:MAG TPA: helix-turn-helix transcriptional regulator [Asanoa sp.]
MSDPDLGGGPTIRRFVVGSQLRRLREARDVTREAAGYAIRGSASKISRMELGRVSFKERDVADLLTLYGVTDSEQRAALLRMAEQANDPAWWQTYEDVLPGWFHTYVGLEEAASLIRTYEVQFLPGLLQTEGYARAVIAAGVPEPSEEEVQRRVDLRVRRQRVLSGTGLTHLWTVLDEAALRRLAGTRSVVQAQIRHLLAGSDRPNVTIQMMPLRPGAHAVDGGSFSILRFPDPELPDVVYVEQLTGAQYLDKREHVDRYVQVMNRLTIEALTPEATADALAKMLVRL